MNGTGRNGRMSNRHGDLVQTLHHIACRVNAIGRGVLMLIYDDAILFVLNCAQLSCQLGTRPANVA